MSEQFAAIFRRRPNDGWFRAGRYDVTTTDLLCVLAVASMFVYGFSRDSFNKLLFTPALVREFELWRLVTWPIATEPDIWPLLGIVFFWLFGQQLEGLFGRNKYLGWVASVTILPPLILTLLSLADSGLDFTSIEFGLGTLFLGGIWVYAATYPGVRWFDVIPLWGIAAVFTLLNLLQYSGNGQTGKVVFLLIGVAVSLIAGRSLGVAQGWPIPHIPLDGSSHRKARRPKQRRSSSPTVVDGPWTRGPAPAPPRSGASPADQIELDALLDKIGANGMDSLTSGEKKRLNELSKRLRNS
jgi:Family of unknown function (DUF6576)